MSLQSFVCFGLILGAAGCGANKNTTTIGIADNNLSYSIDETINGDHCAYTSPTYGSLSSYCTALESMSTNRDAATGEVCGESIRQNLFQQNCSGTFVDQP